MIGFCGLQPLDATPDMRLAGGLRALGGAKVSRRKRRGGSARGFERARLERIVSIAMRENVASTHIMEKLGMKYERETTHRGVPVVLYL